MSFVDLYCERIAPDFWGEPLNALTNVALLIAAWFAWRFARRSREPTGGTMLLIALMVAIAVGSALFHTVANTATRWLDVLPIAAFGATYLWLYVRQVLQAPAAAATICTALFILAAVGARQLSGILNGSIVYAPALALVTGLGLIHLARARCERSALIGAAGALVAALIFRTIDNAACAAFPYGTHFLWHLLTALSLYMVMRAFVANLSADKAGGRADAGAR